MDILGLEYTGKIALYAFSGNAEDHDRFMEQNPDIGSEYQIVKASLYSGGLFPMVDYYNAFDYIICSGGYNLVWDAVYFKKKAKFIPVPVKFCDQRVRIKNAENYSFDVNGADQLVDIMMNM